MYEILNSKRIDIHAFNVYVASVEGEEMNLIKRLLQYRKEVLISRDRESLFDMVDRIQKANGKPEFVDLDKCG